jgi:hypothetical protein
MGNPIGNQQDENMGQKEKSNSIVTKRNLNTMKTREVINVAIFSTFLV